MSVEVKGIGYVRSVVVNVGQGGQLIAFGLLILEHAEFSLQ